MSRVNIKADTETRERLRRLKRDGETWDDLLNRLSEYGELVDAGVSGEGTRECSGCGAVIASWGTVDGETLCFDCNPHTDPDDKHDAGW